MTDRMSDDFVFPFRSMFSPPQSPMAMNDDGDLLKAPPISAAETDKSLSSLQDYEDSFRKFHYYRLSDTATGSTDSSPTTTVSTVDDSSATETSPGSSPESPPPSSGMLRPNTSDDTRPFFELQKQQPPRKGRNLKGLAVNTSRVSGRATSSTSSLPLPLDEQIPLASPSFVKPPTPQKRKPSNLGLTLLTPNNSKAPPQEIKLSIPSTPALVRPATLRHFQSSPSLPVLPQKLSMPLNPRIQPPALTTILSPIGPVPEPVEEEEQNFDIPLSQEEKPEAYPEGPICVYEPYIDLYLEPTAEQCRQYDVVMNVASEVRNPLSDEPPIVTDDTEIRIDGGGGIQYAPKRDTALSQLTEQHTITQDASPTTPKTSDTATSSHSNGELLSGKEPEYIHMKWEHNSDIVPDLLRLVKLIDERVTQGKRILIHCQCGVSRSASLIVAYGLYKNPALSVQEAYDNVKRRSKWIGPNMNLIMQLQEFRTCLQRGGLLPANRGHSPLTPSSAISEWGGPFSATNPQRSHPISAGVDPLTPSQTSASLPVTSPGPSSAPSAFEWPLRSTPRPTQRIRATSAVKSSSAYVNTSGCVLSTVPVLNVVEPDHMGTDAKRETVEDAAQDSDPATPTALVASTTTEDLAMTPLQPSPDVDPADRFGLLSPSSTEFASSPFDRATLLIQLGMGPVDSSDCRPRRAASLKSQSNPAQRDATSLSPHLSRPPRLRGKISSPSIREQEQLHSLQAQIQASLPRRAAQTTTIGDLDEALMSPRATEFTQNPFALALTPPTAPPGQETSRPAEADPRSPTQKMLSPITRNIEDVL